MAHAHMGDSGRKTASHEPHSVALPRIRGFHSNSVHLCIRGALDVVHVRIHVHNKVPNGHRNQSEVPSAHRDRSVDPSAHHDRNVVPSAHHDRSVDRNDRHDQRMSPNGHHNQNENPSGHRDHNEGLIPLHDGHLGRI